ncbi:MAG: homoserine kinase [Candidatus Ancillula sp.]|jgi:homoserine kinase|nr:homoserine kinase [Candidatus Ancillula sp.]
MKTVTIRVPATSANLGPGFDTIGLSLDFYDELTVCWGTGTLLEHRAVEVSGPFSDVPVDETNMVYAIIKSELLHAGFPEVEFAISCINNIPHARGLGSSSAAICSALQAASIVLNDVSDGEITWSKNYIYDKALAIEGHGDNVAPCIFGGIQLVTKSRPGHFPLFLRSDYAYDAFSIRYHIFDEPTKTSDARNALPKEIDRLQAVENSANVAELVTAFSMLKTPDNHVLQLGRNYTRNINEMLFFGTEDHIHQDFRQSVYPESLDRVKKLRGASIPAAISGAGSTIIAFWFDERRFEGLDGHDDFWTAQAIGARYDKFIEENKSPSWEIKKGTIGVGCSVV